MRWKAEKVIHHNDIRAITKFLLIPRCLNGEWRWLERATIKQRFHCGYDDHQWENEEWIDFTGG